MPRLLPRLRAPVVVPGAIEPQVAAQSLAVIQVDEEMFAAAGHCHNLACGQFGQVLSTHPNRVQPTPRKPVPKDSGDGVNGVSLGHSEARWWSGMYCGCRRFLRDGGKALYTT